LAHLEEAIPRTVNPSTSLNPPHSPHSREINSLPDIAVNFSQIATLFSGSKNDEGRMGDTPAVLQSALQGRQVVWWRFSLKKTPHRTPLENSQKLENRNSRIPVWRPAFSGRPLFEPLYLDLVLLAAKSVQTLEIPPISR
jgi:hypothetical protein